MASEAEASCESDPNFAIICAFMEKFGETCGIESIDFVELQQMLENNQEVAPELMNLHIKLLRKTKKNVTVERWERALINMCHTFSSKDAWEIERFGYKKTRLAIKIRALKELLEMQFDYNTKFKNEVNKMTSGELRSQPLGRDKLGRAYWFQTDNNYQIRIYKEDPDEETWNLIAKDRDGLLSLISELTDGDSKLSSDSACNEDSNSLLEKPFIDTGQNENSNSNESKPKEEQQPPVTSTAITDAKSDATTEKPKPEDTIPESESSGTKCDTETKPVPEKVEPVEPVLQSVESEKEEVTEQGKQESSEVKRPMLRIKSLSELMEKPKDPPKASFLPDLPELTITKKPKLDLPEITIVKKPRIPQTRGPQVSSPVVESPVMLIKGNGLGRDNNSGNLTEKRAGHEDISRMNQDNDKLTTFDTTTTSNIPKTIVESSDVSIPQDLSQLIKRTELGLSISTKTKQSRKKSPQFSSVVVSPKMIFRGEGSGKDNKCGNGIIKGCSETVLIDCGRGSRRVCEAWNDTDDSLIIGDEIEEPVMYFSGSGSGRDCETGNEKDSSQLNQDEAKINNSNSCSLPPSESETGEAANQVPTSHLSNFKLGTVIDSKTDSKTFLPRDPGRKSRWDQKESQSESETEEKDDNKLSPKKMTFFFGPGSLNVMPSPVLNSSLSDLEDSEAKQLTSDENSCDDDADKEILGNNSDKVAIDSNKQTDGNLNVSTSSPLENVDETQPEHQESIDAHCEQNNITKTCETIPGVPTIENENHPEKVENEDLQKGEDQEVSSPVRENPEIEAQSESVVNSSISCDDNNDELQMEVDIPDEKNDVEHSEDDNEDVTLPEVVSDDKDEESEDKDEESEDKDEESEEQKEMSTPEKIVDEEDVNENESELNELSKIVPSESNTPAVSEQQTESTPDKEIVSDQSDDLEEPSKLTDSDDVKTENEKTKDDVDENVEIVGEKTKDIPEQKTVDTSEDTPLEVSESDEHLVQDAEESTKSEKLVASEVEPKDVEDTASVEDITKENQQKEPIDEDPNISQEELSDDKNEAVEEDIVTKKTPKQTNDSDKLTNDAPTKELEEVLDDEDKLVKPLDDPEKPDETENVIQEKEEPIKDEEKVEEPPKIQETKLRSSRRRGTNTSQEAVQTVTQIEVKKLPTRKPPPVEKPKKKETPKVSKGNAKDIVPEKKSVVRATRRNADSIAIEETESKPVEITETRSTRQTRKTAAAAPPAVAAPPPVAAQPKVQPVKPTGRLRKTRSHDEAASTEAASTDSPVPLESVTIVDSDSNNETADNVETDPLAVSEEDLGNASKAISSITSFSFDYDPSSPVPAQPTGKRNLRKRTRENVEDKPDVGETGGKKPKMKARRNVDLNLRKSVEEKRQQDVQELSSDENEEVKPPPKKEAKAKGAKVNPQKKRGGATSMSDSDNASQKSDTKSKRNAAKNRRLLKNLGVTEEALSAIADSPAPVRQSSRLAQIKIKEEAVSRRKIDDEDISIKKKKKKQDDKVKRM